MHTQTKELSTQISSLSFFLYPDAQGQMSLTCQYTHCNLSDWATAALDIVKDAFSSMAFICQPDGSCQWSRIIPSPPHPLPSLYLVCYFRERGCSKHPLFSTTMFSWRVRGCPVSFLYLILSTSRSYPLLSLILL